MRNPYLLRCYARPENDYILGMCVDLDIAVRGTTISEVRTEMTKAIESFLLSVDKDNFKDVFPRPVSVSVTLDYCRVLAMVHLLRTKEKFQIFFEELIPKKFEVSLLGV